MNVGLPREVHRNGQTVTTGIFKEPVDGRIALRRLNLDGDRQADLTVHGGPNKAVYAYPAEHYEFWRRELPGMPLPWGTFGENLTVEGFLEDGVNVGDRFRVGSAELMVTQPRMPCYKLELKLGRDDMIERFLASGRSGFYFAVVREGEVEAGDAVELIERDPNDVTVRDITRLYAGERDDPTLLGRATQVQALSDGWRERFRRQLGAL